MAISMSVAVSVSFPSRTVIMTLARIGMVLRRSTTLWTWASPFSRVARSAFSFMASILKGPGCRGAHAKSAHGTVAIARHAGKGRRTSARVIAAQPSSRGSHGCEASSRGIGPGGASDAGGPVRLQHLPQQLDILRQGGVASHEFVHPGEACITVVWSRSPNLRPISGRLRWVICLARYIAT